MFLWNSQCDEINQTGANKYWKKKIESFIKSAFGELNVAQQKKKTKQSKTEKKKKTGAITNGPCEDWTHDLGVISTTLCRLS